jgi:hypothetical protein
VGFKSSPSFVTTARLIGRAGDRLASDKDYAYLDVPLFITEQLLGPLHPNESALTPLLQANIDDTMLREIAAADYGWKADECYALLQPVLKAGLLPSYDFDLCEVLELISFSQPDDPKWKPGGRGQRGHWMRLFACTVLVRLGPRYPDRFGRLRLTLLPMVSSAIELGRSVAQGCGGVLAWRFLGFPVDDTEDPPFLALAILLSAVHLESREDCSAWLKELVRWVDDEESRARRARSGQRSSLPSWGAWLSGSTRLRDRAADWRSLAQRILARPQFSHPDGAGEALRLLGEKITGADSSRSS